MIADPETAALDRILRLPVSPATDTDTRHRLCDLLHETGVFAGLSWPDAQLVADAVSADIIRGDAVEVLRNRASAVSGGRESWDDRNAAACALNIAATAVETFVRRIDLAALVMHVQDHLDLLRGDEMLWLAARLQLLSEEAADCGPTLNIDHLTEAEVDELLDFLHMVVAR
jgi:hypothetical protein